MWALTGAGLKSPALFYIAKIFFGMCRKRTTFVKKIAMHNYKDIIRYSFDKRFGKPCIRETRITVYDVLGWLASGLSFEEILADFPELTKEDILACLAFSAERERRLQYA
jgi:uncharacterized protein (DUF433 family)